jgi:hypothetical protein
MSPLPFPSKKLSAKYNVVAVPLCLSLVMSGIISFVATLRAMGFVSEVFGMWLHAWPISWFIAFPTVLVVLPLVRRFVWIFVEKP